MSPGGRQEILRADRGDLLALDGDGRLEDIRGGDDLAAPNDGVDPCSAHLWGSFSVTGSRSDA